MALEHARLQAEVQAQLEQVRASRARIVEAGDAERRRLERDLHDGAQQRLVTLSLAAGDGRAEPATGRPGRSARSWSRSAGKGRGEALTELRELSRGHPPGGPHRERPGPGAPGAGEPLAGTGPATITAVPAGRFPAAVEATAYFVVSEALANVAKHALTDEAVVTIRGGPDGSWWRSPTTAPAAPVPRRDRTARPGRPGGLGRAACCGWTVRPGPGPGWRRTSRVRDSRAPPARCAWSSQRTRCCCVKA